MKRGTIVLIAVAAVVLLGAFSCVSSYNKLVRLDQEVQKQWAQVETAYQSRADLIPNLVATVKGAAAFEKDTITQVTEARAKVGQTKVSAEMLTDPAAFQQFQAAQDQLSSSLSRLLVVSEAYPDLKATQGFRDLQVQLEGIENRIRVERMRYNEAAQAFNSTRNSFPTMLIGAIFSSKFRDKQFFHAQTGAENVPSVTF